jgi:dGTPase
MTKKIIKWLFEYYTEILSKDCDKNKAKRIACDYIAGMTDRYAIEKFTNHFIPNPMMTKTSDDYLLKLAKL